MKRLKIALFALLGFVTTYGQTTIENPTIGFSSAQGISIQKIELLDTATAIHFNALHEIGDGFSIPKKTYIQVVGENKKLFITSANGIELNKPQPAPSKNGAKYILYFPKIAKSTSRIDYGEGNDGGTWFIYDILLKATTAKPLLPKAMYANWYNTTTGVCDLIIYDNYIVYKNQLWSYDQYKSSKNVSSVKITSSNGNSQIIYFKADKAGNYLFGESTTGLRPYSNNSAEALKTATIDNTLYELPIFKLDTATYSGFIKGYTPRIGMKTMSISVDDIITGEQNTHLIKIDERGYFSIKLPLYYPHEGYLRSSMFNGSIFLEPGKAVFQVFDHSNRENPVLFMGESAKMNTDLDKLMKIRNFDYNVMSKKILDMSPDEYKAFCKAAETKDLHELDSIMKNSKVSAKAHQVVQLDIAYHTMSDMMSYDMHYESVYRKKNKIPRTQRELDIKIDSLTVEYLDFIKPEIANHQMAVIASGYDSFINRLKYLDILRNRNSYSINAQQIGDELAKSGYQFTIDEKEMFEKMRMMDSISNRQSQNEFNTKYGKQVEDFSNKYKDAFSQIQKKEPHFDIKGVDKYFKENKIKLTADEKKLWQMMSELTNENMAKTEAKKAIYATIKDSVWAFFKKHNDFTSEYFAKKGNEARNERLQSLFNIEAGFATDIMLAQDLSQKIVEEVSPVSAAKLHAIQQQFSTPFIAEYIAACNNNSLAKLKANKKKSGFTVNEVPKTEADKIFDAIMQKFRGKVVYVDFWATWCGPCRSGMTNIKPLKEEMDSSKIAFVYITNPSSPLTTWNNMIPDIKGEHYRVSDDEWNYLKSKFNITGIPHYTLVGKDGAVINQNMAHMENNKLKEVLMNEIKK